jgi:branched-chain amino acid transport system permease protein
VTAIAWMIGTFLAGLAGVLLTPLLGLNQATFSVLIISAFAAAVIGRLRSFTWTVVGAVLLGLAQNVVIDFVPRTGFLARAARPSMPFVVMIIFLVAYGFIASRPTDTTSTTTREGVTSIDRPASRGAKATGLGVLVVAALAVPFLLSSFWIGVVAAGVTTAIIFLSYAVVSGEGGMISLCQISLAGIGAMAAAQLITVYHVDPILGILLGSLIAVPPGIVVAVASLRLGELYLTLLTLSFAVLADTLLFTIDRFYQLGSGVAMTRPSLFGFAFDTDVRFLYLVLVVFAGLAVLIGNLRRSTKGLVLAAVRSADTASTTLGISTVRTKIAAFALSAWIAGLGGALLASYTLRATAATFDTLTGLVWFAVVVSWGLRSRIGALLAGITFGVMPAVFNVYLPDSFSEIPPVLFGLGAIVLAHEPRGIVAQNRDAVRHLMTKLGRRPPTPVVADGVLVGTGAN